MIILKKLVYELSEHGQLEYGELEIQDLEELGCFKFIEVIQFLEGGHIEILRYSVCDLLVTNNVFSLVKLKYFAKYLREPFEYLLLVYSFRTPDNWLDEFEDLRSQLEEFLFVQRLKKLGLCVLITVEKILQIDCHLSPISIIILNQIDVQLFFLQIDYFPVLQLVHLVALPTVSLGYEEFRPLFLKNLIPTLNQNERSLNTDQVHVLADSDSCLFFNNLFLKTRRIRVSVMFFINLLKPDLFQKFKS